MDTITKYMANMIQEHRQKMVTFRTSKVFKIMLRSGLPDYIPDTEIVSCWLSV